MDIQFLNDRIDQLQEQVDTLAAELRKSQDREWKRVQRRMTQRQQGVKKAVQIGR